MIKIVATTKAAINIIIEVIIKNLYNNKLSSSYDKIFNFLNKIKNKIVANDLIDLYYDNTIFFKR